MKKQVRTVAVAAVGIALAVGMPFALAAKPDAAPGQAKKEGSPAVVAPGQVAKAASGVGSAKVAVSKNGSRGPQAVKSGLITASAWDSDAKEFTLTANARIRHAGGTRGSSVTFSVIGSGVLTWECAKNGEIETFESQVTFDDVTGIGSRWRGKTVIMTATTVVANASEGVEVVAPNETASTEAPMSCGNYHNGKTLQNAEVVWDVDIVVDSPLDVSTLGLTNADVYHYGATTTA